MPNYNNKWSPNSLNQGFWEEVLVGQEITDVKFDDKGIYSLILGSGEEVFVPRDNVSNLFIKTNIAGGSIHLHATEREDVDIDLKEDMAEVTISVNGADHKVSLNKKLIHSDIAKFAYPWSTDEWLKYLTCVYRSAHCNGSLYDDGPGIWPKPGMHFTCMDTSNA